MEKKREGEWTFDGEVAQEFCDHARKHIPDYEKIIGLCVRIAKKRLRPDSKILDVGSATGYTLQRFAEAGFSNLFGVEASEGMISKSFQGAKLVHSSRFPKESAPFDMVTANWTLHFVLDERAEYVRDVYDGLVPGGCFVLSDKVLQSEFTLSLYHDFKRSQGVSEEEIEWKRKSVSGVLVPYPVEWYLDTLKSVGFTNVEIVNAAPSFVTFLAIK